MFQNLERAMKLMANLKKLFIIGTAYIRHAHLESPTFSLTYLSLHTACPPWAPSPNDILLPILRAHPELRRLSLPGVWLLPEDDIAALEEQNSDAHRPAVLCPRLECVELNGEEILQSFLVGRCVKHLTFNCDLKAVAGVKWGSPCMLQGFRQLKTIVLCTDIELDAAKALTITVARHLVSLSRLEVYRMFVPYRRPVVQSYTPDPLFRSIAQIQSLESLILSATTQWCTSELEQEDMVRLLYKSCSKLKEMFVQSAARHDSHTEYGVGGKVVGMVAREVANKKRDLFLSMIFR